MNNKEFSLNDLVKENFKFINSIEKDAETINNQFVKTNNRFYLQVGEIDCISGSIVVADPLCYLLNKEFSASLEEKIPVGKYPVEVSIYRDNLIGIRMCTARLKIKNTLAKKYVLATDKRETKSGQNKLSGFPVEAGMMCFCDEQVADEYRTFLDKWYSINIDKNHYDDYFAQFFKESYEKLPAYQRSDGDFIEWTNEETNHKMVMVASGFGDGFYQSYWGYDEENEICELIVPMINPDIFEKAD